MTQEEKAKAYDEALKKAQCWLNDPQTIQDCNYTIEDAIQNIFPELAESEDEKVRKEIIEVLQFVPSSMWEQAKTNYERCFAYLERQKYDRMQPIYDNQESFESALDKAWKSYNDSGARTVDGCEDNYTECAHAKGFREGYLFGLEKQKESLHISETCKENPNSFTNEDERVRKAIIEHFKQSETEFPGLTFGGYYYSDVLAYLEKQKDLDKMIVVSPEVWDKAISDAYENGKKDEEKQKEQEPIEIDKEINRWMGCEAFPEGTNITPLPQAMEIVERTAKHFFELGEKTVPSPGGYWEGFNAGVRECQAKSRDAKGAMKEQEPELYYDKELDNAAREFYLSGGAVSPIDSTGLVPIVRMAEFGATWMKERMEKEQKPINLDLDTLVIEFEETIGTSPHSRETIKEFFLKATQKYVNALRKTNKEIGELIEENFYLKEQQPAEWSEKDKDMLLSAIEYVQTYPAHRQSVVTWLKDLPNRFALQPKQEWSEEDEDMLNSCISSIEEAKENRYAYKETDGDTSYDHEIAWLKSLRPVSKESLQPHWKPSEEQMDAVKHAYNSFPNDCSTKSNLRFLYHDLEKLGVREEPEYYQHFDPDC